MEKCIYLIFKVSYNYKYDFARKKGELAEPDTFLGI